MTRFNLNILTCLDDCKRHHLAEQQTRGKPIKRLCDFTDEDIYHHADSNWCPKDMFKRNAEAAAVASVDPAAAQPIVRERRDEFTAADAERVLEERSEICIGCPNHRGEVVRHPNYPHPIDASIVCAVAYTCCGRQRGAPVSLVYGRCAQRKWDRARANPSTL
jgi:hypothetical protein